MTEGGVYTEREVEGVIRSRRHEEGGGDKKGLTEGGKTKEAT